MTLSVRFGPGWNPTTDTELTETLAATLGEHGGTLLLPPQAGDEELGRAVVHNGVVHTPTPPSDDFDIKELTGDGDIEHYSGWALCSDNMWRPWQWRADARGHVVAGYDDCIMYVGVATPAPAEDDDGELVKLHVTLDAAEDGVGGESMWAERRGDDTYMVCNVSFFAAPITYGTVVRAERVGGLLEVFDVVSQTHDYQLFLAFDNEANDDDQRCCIAELCELGVRIERAAGPLYVGVLDEAQLDAVERVLETTACEYGVDSLR